MGSRRIKMTKNNHTIFIVDDEKNVCNALSWLFKSVQFNVETYESAQLFLEKYNCEKQGCIIIDVRLPKMSGLELLEQLKAQKNHMPVIMMTGYGDIEMAVRAMKAGAVDFVLKPFNDQCLLETVQKCISRTANMGSIDLIQDRINSFSDREHQIMNLILDGKLNKQIAYDLEISISTVEAHRANIMHKMQAKNVAQLIKMYLQVQFNNEYSRVAL
jgi:two-component system response regulator FixJ